VFFERLPGFIAQHYVLVALFAVVVVMLLQSEWGRLNQGFRMVGPAELVRLIRRSVDKTQGRRYSDWLEEKSDNEMLWDTTMGMSYQHKKLLEILLGEGERSVEETVVTVEHDYMGVKTKEITRTKYIE